MFPNVRTKAKKRLSASTRMTAIFTRVLGLQAAVEAVDWSISGRGSCVAGKGISQ